MRFSSDALYEISSFEIYSFFENKMIVHFRKVHLIISYEKNIQIPRLQHFFDLSKESTVV